MQIFHSLSKCLLGVVNIAGTVTDPSEMAVNITEMRFYVKGRKISNKQWYVVANEKQVRGFERARGLGLMVVLNKVMKCHRQGDI